MDNKSSAKYKRVIIEKWGPQYQLVPPYMYFRNAVKRAIHTFKAHFLATLAGTCAQLPIFLWDHLLEQAELTLNLMRQATADTRKSSWE